MKLLSTILPAAAAVFLITALLSSCRSGEVLVQETVPAESAMVDIIGGKAARVRSIYCDIMVESLDKAGWERLANTPVYRKSTRPQVRRTPPLAAFLVIVKNSINAPIRLERVRILTEGAPMEALTAAQIRERFRSRAYSWIDFVRMLSFRRLLVESVSMKKIDIETETIETKLDFIPPQDQVITVIAFDRIPVGIRKFRLGFSISAMGAIREIALEFARNEYREASSKRKEAEEDYDR